MMADLRMSVVDFFPFILAFINTVHINCVNLKMSKKSNNGREFTIDLSDEDDYLDFGTDDDGFDNMEEVHNLTLTELLDRDDRRRDERQRREREEREARERDERETRRTKTLENTVNNSGDYILYLFSFNMFITYIFFLLQLLSLLSSRAQRSSVLTALQFSSP